jgi:sugar phosphate isomerase/epimerase
VTLPQLGCHTFGFVWDRDAEAAVAALVANGFSALQLMAMPPHYDPWSVPGARQERLRRTIEASGAELLALDLASSDVNLASLAPEAVAFAVDAYARAIGHGAALGARWLCIGSGRRHALAPQSDGALLDVYRRAFEQILDLAGRCGLKVILENHPNGLLDEAGAIADFLEDYNDVAVIYDVANAAAIGEDPVVGLERLHQRIGIIHLSDAPAGQWRHDPIGSGAIDFAAIGQWVGEAGYAGPVVLEVISPTPLEGAMAGRRRLAEAGWRFVSDH